MTQRHLYVDIVRAKNIIGVNKKNGTSDPYIVAWLQNVAGREIKRERFQTKTVSKTLSPEWDERFTFGQEYDLNSSGDLPTLVLSMYHVGGLMKTDEAMGKITIPLDTIDPNGGTSSSWYPLVGDSRTMKFAAAGEVYVKVAFSGPVIEGGASVSTGQIITGFDHIAVDSEYADFNPNFLRVMVVRGVGLPIMDKNLFGKGGSSDPFVRIRIQGEDTRKTKAITKNLNPVWSEKFQWEHVEDPQLAMEVTVEDQNDVMSSEFMGRFVVPLSDFYDQQPVRQMYRLMSKEGESDGVDRGQVELEIQWTYDPKLATTAKKSRKKNVANIIASATAGLDNIRRGEAGSESEEDAGDDDEMAEAPPPEKSEDQKAAEQKEADDKMAALQNIVIKDGDYQIQVHIIECRDLKGENMDGTSDPVVYVETFGQKQNTTVQYSCTSCVFDELLIFDQKNVDKEMLEENIIRIAVYDSNTIGRNVMIGSWVCDTTMAYFQKDHEYYRKWVPLMDDEDADDVGVQGYMKLSVTVIGPGEKMKVHDEDAEKREEMQREAAAGGDVGALVMAPPNMKKEWVYMVASIYKCEALTVMDGAVKALGITASKAGTDAFVTASFGGAKEVKTRVKTTKGLRAAMNPEFNYELWYPVAIPTMTQLMKISVYDDDATGAELIGGCFVKFSEIDKSPGRSSQVKYINLYGAPEDKNGNLLDNVAKTTKAATEAAQILAGTLIDYKQLYNNNSDRGSTFKGKILARFSIRKKRPTKFDTDEIKPFRVKIPRLAPSRMPAMMEYCLKALVVSGSELPACTPISVTAIGGRKQDLRIKVTIGHIELCTKAGTFNNGVVNWQEKLMSDAIKLPANIEEIPDIIVYLLKEDNDPICFTRIKPYEVFGKTKKLIGFDRPPKWELLQEDKVLDHLDDGEFPGSVLLKLGFGPMSEAKSAPVVSHWGTCVEHMKSKEPHQVRVHIYQARDVDAADGNGLSDPYVKVSFMGLPIQKTSVKNETLYPCWYETKTFDVELPLMEYAPQVNFKLFDKDTFGKDNYLGCCVSDLRYAQRTAHNAVDTEELQDPVWVDFYKELPGDGKGSLLVLVQLIKKLSPSQKFKEVPDQMIKPASRKGFIEIIAVGCRDMAPYNFQPMQYPYLEFVMDAMGKKSVVSTAPSKRPNPSNPNYLERIVMEADLPEKAIFAAPLCIRAHDTRLGGYLKPEVGVGTIYMVPKIPWWPFDLPLDDMPNPPTYVAPQKQVFCASPTDKGTGSAGLATVGGAKEVEMVDQTAEAVKAVKEKRDEAREDDDFVTTLEAPNVAEFVKARMNKEETGAGVFGALRHINVVGQKKKSTFDDAFGDPDWSQDDSDQPPAWSIGRKTLEAELEEEFKTTPFETYPLTRGNPNGPFGSTLKTVGKFKGLIRVMRHADDAPMFPKEIMQDLFKPKLYKVRLYCLRGVSLAKMDIGVTGKPESSDPYLMVKLGKFKYNDVENAVEDATDVDFYKYIEMDAELPGTSQLQISVMDKDIIGTDDLIGKTTIDLEDRWFDGRWQEWGKENRVTEAGDTGTTRFDTKPIEARTLYLPGKASGQGVLTCWVDIMKPEEASFFEADDVALPPTQTFEVRLVIWKSKGVPAMDELEGMSDLYVKAWPEGCDPQETDTHWRCKKGKASWNWRMLFDVELGHSTRAMKFPFLHVQLWDRDLLKFNDCAGEVHMNLEKYYRKAYKRNMAIKLFEKKKGAAAKREAQGYVKPPREVEDTTDDIPAAETDADVVRMQEDLASQQVAEAQKRLHDSGKDHASKAGVAQKTVLAVQKFKHHKAADSDDDDGDDHAASKNTSGLLNQPDSDDDEDAGVGVIATADKKTDKKVAKSPLFDKNTSSSSSDFKQPDKTGAVDTSKKGSSEDKSSSWFSWFGSKKEDDETPLLEEDEEAAQTQEEKDAAQDSEELMAFISQIKGMTGLYDDDPEESEWMHFEKQDKNNPGKPESMGYVAYSLQIWPKEKAVAMPVGSAQLEPNNNPYCPPPVGRLQFSFNPFVMGSELCGPKLCAYFTCCLACAGFICLMIFCQPFINIIINLIFLCA